MSNKATVLTSAEIREIAAIREIQQMWGADDANDMAQRIETDICAVKFSQYTTDGPGYSGELFLLMGGALEAPLMLIRKKGKLTICEQE